MGVGKILVLLWNISRSFGWRNTQSS